MNRPVEVTGPTVTVLIPAFQEEGAIGACLEAVANQTYPHIREVLVVDGGSSDRTREIAAAAGALVLDNPRRIQAAALNVGIARARGEVIVRVDGHCVIAPDYVERCVAVLAETGAAMVGGAMTPVATGTMQRGIAAAMASPFGAGPARFHTGGDASWVDTVYLGAYRTTDVRAVGGYAEDVGVNEDAELAYRLGRVGGVRFDPTIFSTYTPRDSLPAVAKQFYRYGLSRVVTARRHPRSVSPRQMVAPALVIGLAIPATRRPVALAYAGVVALAAARCRDENVGTRLAVCCVLPAMHLTWGAGFLAGIVGVAPPRPVGVDTPSAAPHSPSTRETALDAADASGADSLAAAS